MIHRISRLLVSALVFLGAAQAYAEQYPAKVITIIVPFAAGGPSDTIARLTAQAMGTILKGTMIVENVAGAGGTIGAARLTQAKPDGYTLFIHHIGHATAPALYRKLSYDAMSDFEPVGLINDGAMTFVARKDFPAKDLKELLAYGGRQQRQGQHGQCRRRLGLAPLRHAFHVGAEDRSHHHPLQGDGAGHERSAWRPGQLMCDQTTNTTSHIKAGKIKVYGVTTPKRIASMPEVPTMNEAGMPNFTVTVWHALYAPKGTPKAIVEQLSKALQDALKNPTLKQRFADLGSEPVAQERATPEALRVQLKSEIEKWGPIIKNAGVFAD